MDKKILILIVNNCIHSYINGINYLILILTNIFCVIKEKINIIFIFHF